MSDPDKYICAGCRRKFKSAIRPPLHLGQKYGRDGCRVEQTGDVQVFTCSRTLTGPGGSRFQGSEYACSTACAEVAAGRRGK